MPTEEDSTMAPPDGQAEPTESHGAASPDVSLISKRATNSTLEPETTKYNYTSKIGILTCSLPIYHNQFMEQRRKMKEAQREKQGQQDLGEDASEVKTTQPKDIPKIEGPGLDPPLQSPDEQAETARRLKPISLSTLQLQNIVARPLSEAQEEPKVETKKPKTRWQFGIRSRNLPHEAMHCVYKALIALGAEWEIASLPTDSPELRPRSYPVHVQGATQVDEAMSPSRAPSPEMGRKMRGNNSADDYYDGSSSSRERRRARADETEDEDIDTTLVPSEYMPKDPWCIRVRWRKDNLPPVHYPTGQTISAHSSRHDLSNPVSRRTSVIGSNASASNSVSNVTDPKSTHTQGTALSTSCYVYMDVQLYTLEAQTDKNGGGCYLVDFKCAGYEPLIERVFGESQKEMVGVGYKMADKDVTSPQPFLDMTNRLVIYLASGGS